MSEKANGLLGGKVGKVAVVILLVGAVVGVVWALRNPDPSANFASQRIFIDAENGKSFSKEIAEGDTFPMTSPFTGKATGYEAELCYWTKDGQPKTEPTPVLLNEYRNTKGPTFCPDCGRLVVGHNPTMAMTAWLIQPEETRAETYFPTSGIAVFEIDVEWSELDPGVGTLVATHTPHDS